MRHLVVHKEALFSRADLTTRPDLKGIETQSVRLPDVPYMVLQDLTTRPDLKGIETGERPTNQDLMFDLTTRPDLKGIETHNQNPQGTP